MINLLGIGLDYLMLEDNKVRGDVRQRQFVYAKSLKSFHLIVYSPKHLGYKPVQWADNLWVYPTNSRNKASFVLDALKIGSNICKKNTIDVITTEDPFTTGLVGCLLKRKFHLPLNIQVHSNFCNNSYWRNNRRINQLFHALGKYTLKRADTIRVGTTTDKNSIASIGVNKEKIHIIPVNLNLEKFFKGDGKDTRGQLLEGKLKNIIMFVGRLSKEKDLPTLISAFNIVCRQNPDALLVIIGSGAQEQRLKELTKSLNLAEHIKFLGNIDHDDLPDSLAAADVFVISSLFEGTCIAMAEALAVGVPVVSTNVAGARDLIIEGETGFVVAQRDSNKMAERILYSLENTARLKESVVSKRNHLEEIFSNNRNIEKVLSLWEETKR